MLQRRPISPNLMFKSSINFGDLERAMRGEEPEEVDEGDATFSAISSSVLTESVDDPESSHVQFSSSTKPQTVDQVDLVLCSPQQ